jgi:hypothetical protein
LLQTTALRHHINIIYNIFHKAVFLSQSGIAALGTAETEFPASLPVSQTGPEDAVTCSYSIRVSKTKMLFVALAE